VTRSGGVQVRDEAHAQALRPSLISTAEQYRVIIDESHWGHEQVVAVQYPGLRIHLEFILKKNLPL